MNDGTLRERLWRSFARLQTLLGGEAAGGKVVEHEGLVASFVPIAPDSPTLNAAVALAPAIDPQFLQDLTHRYRQTGARRWGVWVDGDFEDVIIALHRAGLRRTSSSPGMGAAIQSIALNGRAPARPTDLATVGLVNDLAYGNPDARLERTLAPLPAGVLRAYRADHDGQPAAVALALHQNEDCGVSFVATVPHARRQGLATDVMHRVLVDAREQGCTTATLQATDLGERLYTALGFHKLSDMQLWEHRG
jgi:GNAT superfamily N-acetyltransferase